MDLSERRFSAFDQIPIVYRRRFPEDSPRALLFVVHGMGEYGARYLPHAETLARRGICVVVMDLRGHGQSGGPRVFVREFEDYHKDLERLIRLERDRLARLPFFVLGHSLGGLIAASWASGRASDCALSGLILNSPCLGLAEKAAPIHKRIAAELLSRLRPQFLLPDGIRPEQLLKDDRLLRLYRQDTLIERHISPRLYTQMMRVLAQTGSIAARIDCPTLMLLAGCDSVVSNAAAETFFSKIPHPDRSLEIGPETLHERIHDSGCELLWGSVGDWVLRRCQETECGKILPHKS
ncbi:MAG: lysophospholipase [Candidatus Omnitrophota bacterium]